MDMLKVMQAYEAVLLQIEILMSKNLNQQEAFKLEEALAEKNRLEKIFTSVPNPVLSDI